MIVQPFFTRNSAYYLESPGSTDGQAAKPFDWSFCYSPRVELGYQGEKGKLGVRGRYWFFNGCAEEHPTSGSIHSQFAEDSIGDDIGLDGVSDATFEHEVTFHVVDVEAILNKKGWTGSAGFRFTNMDQCYTAKDMDSSDRFDADHCFTGFGLTSAIEFRQRLGSEFNLFAIGRGSLLYGCSEFEAHQANTNDYLTESNDNDLIGCAEMQLGVNWRRCLSEDFQLVIKAAAEAQYWANAGTGAPGNSHVFDEGNYQNSNPMDASLGFIGFNLTVGLTY